MIKLLAASDANEATSSINADDTLEEIEYVLDRGLNYVPKRLINEIKSKSESEQEFNNDDPEDIKENDEENEANDENDEGIEENDENDENAIPSSKVKDTTNDCKWAFNDDEIIVLDSSPECSFVTLQATERFKTTFDTTDNTFYTAKSNLNNVSILSIDSSDSSDGESTAQAIETSITPSEVDEKPSTSLIPDVSVADFSSSTHRDVSTVSSVNYGEMPNFNDTLERVEYMMEQGQKMMDDSNYKCPSSTATTPISAVAAASRNVQTKKTPISQTKLKPKVLTPNSGPMKKVAPKHLTPNNGDLFKRPDQRNYRSPYAQKTASASKVTPAQPHSRIPTKTGSLHKPQFRHIASPIAAYINNTPEVPLLKTIKPMRNLLTGDFNKVCKPSSLDESTQSVESYPTKSALPRKMYISAPQRKVSL